MHSLDRFAYVVKAKIPLVYDVIAVIGRVCTMLLYGRAISRAARRAGIEGTVLGHAAHMRLLMPEDLDALIAMIEKMPDEHLTFFHPHGLDRSSLANVIARQDIMTYGLFSEDMLHAYAILKLFPTKKAYIGRLVSPSATGFGVGRFLSRYLYWQAQLLGFQPCSTIHEDNVSSLRSHAAVRPYEVVAELLNGYRLVGFHTTTEDSIPPELCIRARTAAARQDEDRMKGGRQPC
jgi:hypothetical protein